MSPNNHAPQHTGTFIQAWVSMLISAAFRRAPAFRGVPPRGVSTRHMRRAVARAQFA